MTRPRDIADSINRINSSAADATAMTIDSSERVGIGTSSPAAELDVVGANAGSGTADTVFRLSQPASTISANNEIRSGVTSGTNPYLAFAVREGSSPFNTVERMRIDSSGNVGIGTSPSVKLDIDNGSLKVNRGNSSGDIAVFRGLNAEKVKIDTDGIKFNGDTAAANAIDDYEEGTWTPGITGMTFENAGGAYTKIGRRVQCSGFLINCTSGTASSTTAKLSGLPYTVSNTLSITSLEDGGAFTYFLNLGRSTSFVSIAPDDSSTECFLYFTVGASTGFTSLLRTDLDNSSLSTRFFFTYISI